VELFTKGFTMTTDEIKTRWTHVPRTVYEFTRVVLDILQSKLYVLTGPHSVLQ